MYAQPLRPQPPYSPRSRPPRFSRSSFPPFTDDRSVCEAARGGADIDGHLTRGEREIEDRGEGEVRRDRCGRGEKFGRRVVGSQSSSKMPRDAIAGAAWICHQEEEKNDAHSVRCVGGGGVTFVICIASWACAMLSIESHSVICSRKSRLTVSVLSPGRPSGNETLIHVIGQRKAQTTEAIRTGMVYTRYERKRTPMIRLGLGLEETI